MTDLITDEGELVLGIQPEDLTLTTTDPEQLGDCLTATVALVEELGAEALVRLRLGSDTETEGPPLVLRASGQSRLSSGDRVHATVDVQRFQFFDPETGSTLDANTL